MTENAPRRHGIAKLGLLGLFVLVTVAGAVAVYLYVPLLYSRTLSASINQSAPKEEDPYLSFTGEVYGKIKTNYWDKITDEQLSELFRLGLQKIASASEALPSKDEVGVKTMVATALETKDADAKKDLVTKLANIVLVNLKPFGRSQLLTEKQKQALIDTVSNVDRNKDLYAMLDLPKTASVQAVEDAYVKKEAELKEEAKKDPEAAQKKLAEAQHAREILTDALDKQRYDKTGAEPTVTSHLISPTVAYIKLDRFSPQTFEEFVATANSIKDTPGLDSLVLDLRDNIGGAVDLLQYFLGPFIGPNQYAYEFFHQGDLTPYKTKTGWLESLVKYKKVVILVNEKSQSSAEVMAVTLKKYHVGIVVGTTTKGWGTIEQLIPLEHQIDGQQKYSMIIVQSVTLREDSQPIESKGVDPTIKITDKDWGKQLLAYFNYQPLIDAVKKAWNNPTQ